MPQRQADLVCVCETISAFFTYMKGVSIELELRHVPQVAAFQVLKAMTHVLSC